MGFERNEGQTDAQVRFVAHGLGYGFFLTDTGAVLALGGPRARQAVVRLELMGANRSVEVSGEDELAGKANYFIGRDPRGWHTNIPTYARVQYRGVYRGIDLVYYGRAGEMENDFVVAPGADPGEVRMKIEGGNGIRLTKAGALVVETKAGEVELHRPIGYQGKGAEPRQVRVRYEWRGNDMIGLSVAGYRRSEPLVIDPVLSYSTYLGGSGGDAAYAIAVDSSDDAYVCGSTASVNFPVKSAAFSTNAGNSDAFIAKVNPAGSALIYSTYLGGSKADVANGIAVDASGNAYVVGTTASSDFPATPGAYQTSYASGATSNGFVAKLDPTGSSLAYATYLGGSAQDAGQAIAVDSAGNAYVTGSTTSPNFPTQPVPSPIQPGNNGCTLTSSGGQTCTADAFISEVNSTGTSLVFSTYLGGSNADSGQAIALDAQNNVYIAGYTSSTDFKTQNPLQHANGGGIDGFIAEIGAGGSKLVFSTYWGGSGDDKIFGLALDSNGDIYAAGQTTSSNLGPASGYQPTYAGNGDAFVSKFAPQATSLTYSTFLGGSGPDQANAIAVDASGDAVVVGYTQSSDFPVSDPFQTIPGISGAGTCGTVTCADAFIARLNPSGQIPGPGFYVSYLGGNQNDYAQGVALDPSGIPYVAGITASTNFPVIAGALQGSYAGSGASGNAFIVKVDPSDAPGVALTPQVVNFGNQTINQASNPGSVTIINEGSAPLQNISVTATAPFAIQNNTCGNSLAAGGGYCTINIIFTPQNPGTVTGQVSISDNAANSPQVITVTGTGVTAGAGALTLTPSTLTFANQTVGTISSRQAVQIINSSKSSVSITAFNVTGQFTQSNNCGATPVVLNSGAGCTATIFFAPTSGGAQTGSFSVASNAAGSAAVSLSGFGSPVFTLSSNAPSSTVLVGTSQTTFTIAASAPSSFTSSISLSCSSSATCSFSPSSITGAESSQLTVTKLASNISPGVSPMSPVGFTVTGSSAGSQTSTIALTVFFSDFSLSATPPLGQVTAGASASYTVTVTPANGFNQAVLLSCAGGLPAKSSCSFSPPGVILNGTTTATTTLTITTTSQITSGFTLLHVPSAPHSPGGKAVWSLWFLAAGALLLSLGLWGAWRKLPRLRPKRSFWLLVALGLLLLGLTFTACNNLYYQNNISPAPAGTPSGVFPITIQGTLGSNSSVTRSTTVNLSVGPSTG